MATKDKKKKGKSYGGPSGGPHGSWKSKPKAKPKKKPTKASLPPSMGFQPSGGGVDRGLREAVANQAAKNASIAADRATGKFSGSPPSTSPSGIANIGFGKGQIDPKLAQAAGLTQGQPWVSTSGWTVPSGTGTTIGPVGMGGDPTKIVPPLPNGDDDDDKTITTTTTDDEYKKKKAEEEAKQESINTAKALTKWWSENKKGQGYKERKNILTGKLWGSQEAVTAKLQDKLNKGFYKIVKGPEGEPLIIHASTGTPVNPYTGNIISTQTVDDQGGAYQNEMARITGIDPKHAGVFSKEYQTGNGLAVENMKPQHALRFLMKKNPGAFEEFFNAQKGKKGFNPFSAGFLTGGMDYVLGKLSGTTALKVGNNLERAGWGKAIEGEDGKYTVKLTEHGAEQWSDSFGIKSQIDGQEFSNYVSPKSIEEGGDKIYSFLERLGINDPKFPKQPIDLTNLIAQEGYFEGMVPGSSGSGGLTTGEMLAINKDMTRFDPKNPKQWLDETSLQTLDPYLNPDIPFSNKYSYPDASTLRDPSQIPGTDKDYQVTDAGVIQNYPTFTPEGYKIGAYNPTRDYSGRTSQTQTGDGSGGGDDDDDTTTQGPLSFNVFGKPNINYDYTGGPEQIQLGGGWMRDGQYINSPWGGPYYAKDGGIANFKPYGY